MVSTRGGMRAAAARRRDVTLTLRDSTANPAPMRARVWSGAVMVVAATMIAGCGGDNLEFCDGCGTPTPTVTVTPTPTATPTIVESTGPTSTPSRTPTVPLEG